MNNVDLYIAALGIREADCGCCKIVDSVGLQDVLTELSYQKQQAEYWKDRAEGKEA